MDDSSVFRLQYFPKFPEKPCSVFKSGKHLKFVEIIESHLPKISNLAECKGNWLAKGKVIGDFHLSVWTGLDMKGAQGTDWEEMQGSVGGS